MFYQIRPPRRYTVCVCQLFENGLIERRTLLGTSWTPRDLNFFARVARVDQSRCDLKKKCDLACAFRM